MDSFWLALLLATLAGASIPVGAAFATRVHMRSPWLEKEFRHTVIAFGGGALLAAVSLVLVPDGSERLGIFWATLSFAGGGLAFFLVERTLARSGGSYSQLLAMMLDYVPEAIALGAAFATGAPSAYLLAALIAMQNLPEGFNAYSEMARSSGQSARKLFALFCILPLTGLVSAWLGHEVAADQPALLGGLMLFASAGIIYLIFEDIAPQVPLQKSWAPPLGAVAGFLLGLIGHMLTA